MKYIIKNRYGLNIILNYEEVPQAKGIVFLQHGLSGFKEQRHMVTMAEVFQNYGISTINFDATHSFGESEGELIHATITAHYQDLVDVVEWAKTQVWFQTPFYLAGHSMGGATVLNYTIHNPQSVCAVAPISSVVSGALWKATKSKTQLKEWQEKGYYEKVSSSKKGMVGKVNWNLMKDAQQYDFSIGLDKLKMPALFVVGSEDTSTLPEHQKRLYDNWGGLKDYHEFEKFGHTFRTDEELKALRMAFNQWLEKIV